MENDGVEEINAYAKEHFGDALECRITPGKGRTVYALRDYKVGEVILQESPLHIVQVEKKCEAFCRLQQLCEEHEDSCDFEPLWYWCALRSLTEEDTEGSLLHGWKTAAKECQRKLLLLHHEKESLESSPGAAAALIAKELALRVDPSLIESLTQVWVLNSFEHSDEPEGLGTYFFSSFMSHSCYPNAIWHDSGNDHVVRARRDIKVGDEICISYLSEEWLLRSAYERRWDLSTTKLFWCSCERCHGGQDLSRGFKCPNCTKGVIFAPTPAYGPQTEQTAPLNDLLDIQCSDCGHAMSPAQVEKISGHEKSLQILYDDLSERLDEDYDIIEATELATFIEFIFPQHYLADLAWDRLISIFRNNKMHSEVREFHELRCKFGSKSYHGYSMHTASAMEAYADELCGLGSCSGRKRQLESNGEVWALSDLELAAHYYSEAHNMNSALYGFDDPEVMETMHKFSKVQDMIAKPPVKVKRIRLRHKQLVRM